MKDDVCLKDFLDGVKNEEYYSIIKFERHFIRIIRKLYNENMLKKYGRIFEKDVINGCFYKMIVYSKKFKGTTWREFESYNIKIITSVILNQLKSNSKIINITLFTANTENDFNEESQTDYIYNKYKSRETMEDRILDKIVFKQMLEYFTSRLNKKEKKIMCVIINCDNLREYSRKNNCNYNALRQRVYRLRKKLNKLRKKYYLEMGLDQI